MPGPFGSTARGFRLAGFAPIPIMPGLKRPPLPAWTQYCSTPPTLEQIESWMEKYENFNVGLACGTRVLVNGETKQIVAVDIDDENLVEAVLKALPFLGPTKKGKKGLTAFALMDVTATNHKFKRSKEKKPSVEILAHGSQTVVPPSIHPDTKLPYTWTNGDLLSYTLDQLPFIGDAVLDEIHAICSERGEVFERLNGMVWLGVGGGGNTHDVCVSAVASLVSRGWTDSDISERVQRAKRNSVERAGEVYHWPEADSTIQEWVTSARNKGMTERLLDKKPKVPLERQIATWALSQLGEVKTVSGVLRKYHEGHWPTVDIHELLRSIYAHDPMIREREAKAAVSILHTLTEVQDFGHTREVEPRNDVKRQRICLQNGTLNLRTGALEQWSPDHEILHQLTFSWDDEAECNLYDSVVTRTFDGDERAINLWEEFCALSLIDDMSFQSTLFLKGPGGNGKGTLARVLRNLHSPEAVGSVAITDLNDERKRTSLIGKLINISGEQSRLNTVADAYFKKITGGDPIDTRRLYGETVNNVVLSVRFLELVNDMPMSTDTSYAIKRRFIILPCPNRVLAPDQDLDRKLLAERPGILRRLVTALARLYERGRFEAPTSSSEEVDAYLTENDPVLYWMIERTEEVDEGTSSRDLWIDYKLWSDFQGYYKVLPEVVWGRKLKGAGYPSFNVRVADGHTLKFRRLRIKAGLELPI